MIIYCPTIKDTEAVYAAANYILSTTEYKAGNIISVRVDPSGMYHASLSDQDRQNVHTLFMQDDVHVLVATEGKPISIALNGEAFGMGIDKPDIRTIINYGPTRSIEAYYQQVI